MELNAVGHNEGLLSLATLGEVLWLRRGLVIASFLALFGAAVAFVETRPAQYDADVKFIVKRTRTEGPVDVAKGQGGAAAADLSEMEIASEIELFKNRRSLEEAARRCGLVDETDHAGDENARLAVAVQRLQSKLAIKRVDNTNLIAVQYRHPDPAKAAQTLQSLTDSYLAEHLALHRNWRTSQFFDEQTGMYQQQLAQAEKSLGDFLERHRVSMLEAEKTATLARQNQLEGILQDAESEIHDAKDRIAELNRQVGGVPETIETQSRTARNETLLERLKTRVLELEAKRTELLTKYDKNYRLVREVDQQVADTQAMLSREQDANVVVDRTRALNPLRQGIEAERFRTKTTLSGLEAKRGSIAQDYAQARAKLREFEQITAEHNELVRAVKLAEESYLMYQKRWEESRLEDAMDEEKILNVSVLDPVVLPALPVDQHRPFLLVLGAFMALAGSLAAGLAAEYAMPALRRGMRNEEAAEPVEPPVIPSRAREEESHNWRRRRGPAPAERGEPERAAVSEVVTVPAVIERGGAIQVMLCRELAMRDEYGYVIDCVRLYQGRQEGVAIGLAANILAEEAAIAAVQLAASMYRRNGLPVLLVDAANANEPLTHFFGSPQGPGFRDLLLGPQGGENQCVHRTSFENLWILPPGFGALNGNASPDRVAWLRKALGNGTMNLVVRLPEEVNGSSWLMPYGILDGALSDLRAEDGGVVEVTDEIVRRVLEAKRGFDEQRLTLVGGSREWRSDSKESLTVC